MVEHFQNLIIINVRTYIVMCVHYGNHSVEEKVSNVRCDLIKKNQAWPHQKLSRIYLDNCIIVEVQFCLMGGDKINLIIEL